MSLIIYGINDLIDLEFPFQAMPIHHRLEEAVLNRRYKKSKSAIFKMTLEEITEEEITESLKCVDNALKVVL